MAAELTGLAGRAVLMTGAGGIGSAAAAQFLAQGAQVLVLDREEAALEELRAGLPGVRTLHADLLDAHTASRAVAAALEQFGRLDVLLNVAGLSGRRYGDGPAHLASDEGWDTVMNTNARTVFQMSRAALVPMLAARSGCIISVASVLAYSPAAEHFATHAYAASKAAIIGLTRAMAASYAAQGVRVNAVAPGLIATPMSVRAQSDAAVLAYIAHRQPLTGALGTPDDVAQAALYLAQAEFVTGTVLEVAGGWSVAG